MKKNLMLCFKPVEMAASVKETDKIERLRERLLLCTICMDEYKDPRILPCHHSVCLECLEQYVRLSTATGYCFRCPQCRAEIMVPNGGIKDFPPNFFVSSLMDEIGTKTYSSSCEICERSGLSAQFRCIDCDKDICRFCIPEHKLFKHNACRTPGIIRIETAPASEAYTANGACLKHGEPPNVYCEQCKEILCLSCVCDIHKSHKTTSLAQKLQSIERDLGEERLKLVEESENIEQDLENLDEFAEKICRRYGAVRMQIESHAEHLHKVVQERAASQINKVDDVEQDFMTQVEMYREDYGKYHKQVSNACDFLSDVQHEDVSLELAEQFTKYKSLMNSTKKTISKKIKFSEVSFMKGIWMLFLGMFVFAFGYTRKKFLRTSYKFHPSSYHRGYKYGRLSSIWSKTCSFLALVRRHTPRIPCPKWLSSVLALLYVVMVTILMIISLVYLAHQYLVIGDEECYDTDILVGFCTCSFLFLVFGATVHKAYWYSLKAMFKRTALKP